MEASSPGGCRTEPARSQQQTQPAGTHRDTQEPARGERRGRTTPEMERWTEVALLREGGDQDRSVGARAGDREAVVSADGGYLHGISRL